MKTLIINLKNYPEIFGDRSMELTKAAEAVAKRTRVEIVVCPPQPLLGLVASGTRLPVFSQAVQRIEGAMTTGAITPEAVKSAGAVGTLLNHSEARIPRADVAALVPRLKSLRLKVCICAGSTTEAKALSGLNPDYLAIEPPELIGSGVAVSEARPELVSATVAAARKAGYTGRILCGAGIVRGRDVERAVELGVDGVLVASSIVKAEDWGSKIREIALPLV